MKGAAVATLTQNDFTPWWATFTTQFVSPLITWPGLKSTSRGFGKHPKGTNMPLPLNFLDSAPIGNGRIML
jgi:hypothetical protein